MLPFEDPTSLSMLFHLNSEPWLNDEAYRRGAPQPEPPLSRRVLGEVVLPEPTSNAAGRTAEPAQLVSDVSPCGGAGTGHLGRVGGRVRSHRATARPAQPDSHSTRRAVRRWAVPTRAVAGPATHRRARRRRLPVRPTRSHARSGPRRRPVHVASAVLAVRLSIHRERQWPHRHGDSVQSHAAKVRTSRLPVPVARGRTRGRRTSAWRRHTLAWRRCASAASWTRSSTRHSTSTRPAAEPCTPSPSDSPKPPTTTGRRTPSADDRRRMKLFLSYATRDTELVASLQLDLEQFGHEVWRDVKIVGGQDWWDRICSQLRWCDAVVFAISPSSVRSRPCQSELDYALALGRPLLPVMIVDTKLATAPVAVQATNVVSYRGSWACVGHRARVGARADPRWHAAAVRASCSAKGADGGSSGTARQDRRARGAR